jgi:hypothetical protein
MATPIWVGARSCYRFRDYGAHSAQTEQSGETASLISLSRRLHFISWRDQMLAVFYDVAARRTQHSEKPRKPAFVIP